MRFTLCALTPLMLAACLSVRPDPQAETGCIFVRRESWAEIRRTAVWAHEGRVIHAWALEEVDALFMGSATGRASLRIDRTLVGRPSKLPYVTFSWGSSWTDTEPFVAGHKPLAGERYVVWSNGRYRDDAPAACIDGLPPAMALQP